MLKVQFNNTNSRCPYCETKEYVNDWNNKENKSLEIGETIDTKCSSCGEVYKATLEYMSGRGYGIRYFKCMKLDSGEVQNND